MYCPVFGPLELHTHLKLMSEYFTVRVNIIDNPLYFRIVYPIGITDREVPMRRSRLSTQIRTAADLGKAIRSSRKRGGLTLAETAGLTNIGVRFLSELENGKPTVRLDKTLQVLSALGLQLHIGSPVAPERD